MIFRKTVSGLKQFIKKCGDDNIGAFSAQSAFFVIISAFPLAILIMSVIKLFYMNTDEVINITVGFLPEWLNKFISNYVNEITKLSNRTIISISSIVALFSASRGIFAIINGLNCVAGAKETRSYIRLQITACIYTVIFITIIIITLGVLVFGNTIYNRIYTIIPEIKDLAYLLNVLRTIFSLAVLTVFFILVYRSVPNKKTNLSSQVPGALLCSLGWTGFSYLYSYYIKLSGNHPLIYGSLSNIVLFMLWLYFCMYMLFIGAEVNNVLSIKNSDFKFGKTQRVGHNKQ